MIQTFVQTILQTQSSYRQVIHRKIREHNIDVTFEMLHILRCLNDAENINQQELANMTFKDKSSLSYLIKNMEKRNLVSRIEDETDRRSKLVQIAPEGKKLYASIQKLIDEVYSKIEEDTNKKHIEVCIEYMQEFTGIIKKH